MIKFSSVRTATLVQLRRKRVETIFLSLQWAMWRADVRKTYGIFRLVTWTKSVVVYNISSEVFYFSPFNYRLHCPVVVSICIGFRCHKLKLLFLFCGTKYFAFHCRCTGRAENKVFLNEVISLVERDDKLSASFVSLHCDAMLLISSFGCWSGWPDSGNQIEIYSWRM